MGNPKPNSGEAVQEADSSENSTTMGFHATPDIVSYVIYSIVFNYSLIDLVTKFSCGYNDLQEHYFYLIPLQPFK